MADKAAIARDPRGKKLLDIGKSQSIGCAERSEKAMERAQPP